VEWGLENRIGDAALRHHGYTKEIVKERGKVERNLRLLERAIDEIPDDPLLFMNYGLELMRSERIEEGLRQYRIAFDLMSEKPAATVVPETREALLTQYCTHLRIAKRPAEVLTVLSSPLARTSELTASQHLILGLAHMELQDFPAAAQQMRHCLAKRAQPALTPVNPDVRKAIPRQCLAICLWQAKDADGADREFKAAIAEAPDAAKVHIDYGRFLHEHGKTVDALQLLNQFTSANPAAAAAWTAGGQIALSQPGLLEVAVDWTAVALENHPQDATVSEQRAEALMLAGQLENALALWTSKASGAAQPRVLAARILCEIALGIDANVPPSFALKAVEQEFARWYWRLVEFGAEASVLELHAKVGALERVLPLATQLLRSVFAKIAVAETV
jgi:Tfp pilus assembly protein PilF